MRAMLLGKAHRQREGGTHRSWTTDQIFREWQLAPTAVDLMIKRLNWWKDIFSDPDHRAQFLA
eukprot:4449114-Pyramimonas_sp.AAC.1